ncbi:MAG TPA: MarR family transcriptional regulator [Acidimicrobiales bacterium]|nr:MarR family transcriptional regulator [Acidimicrobiales bacterium]
MPIEPVGQHGAATAATLGPGSPAPGSHEPGSFGRAAAWLSKQVELALGGVELSLPQYRVLGVLAEGASMPSALAERLTVRRPTVTAVVDGLEGRGLVQRTPGDLDKRSVTHTLTPKGQRLLAKANTAVDARLTDIAACLDDPALTDQALGSLELWRGAMRAYHSTRTAGP